MRIYGDAVSGNCLKVKWVADWLELEYDWHPVDVVAGEARDAAFLAVNPAGKVPAVVLDGGELLTESNAIIHYLARGSALVPEDALAHARMLQWMFWEQYSHEPYIAVRRYQLSLAKLPEAEIDPRLKERGDAALATMERHLQGVDWFASNTLSLADVALVAYTRWADEGGFVLADYPAVEGWVWRVERALRIN